MLSRVRIIPTGVGSSSYVATTVGEVYSADQPSSFYSATTRGGETTIRATITPRQQSHRFLIRHDRPLEVDVRGDAMMGARSASVGSGSPNGETPALPSSRAEPPGQEESAPKKEGRIISGIDDRTVGITLAATGALMFLYASGSGQ